MQRKALSKRLPGLRWYKWGPVRVRQRDGFECSSRADGQGIGVAVAVAADKGGPLGLQVKLLQKSWRLRAGRTKRCLPVKPSKEEASKGAVRRLASNRAQHSVVAQHLSAETQTLKKRQNRGRG